MTETFFVLERILGPAIEPVTLAEAKRHIRQYVNVTTEDADVTALIQVAREWVENYTGRAMVDQTWKLTVQPRSSIVGDVVSGFVRPGCYCGPMQPWSAADGILLRRSPIIEVETMYTIDSQGVETLVDASTYQLREPTSRWPRLVPLTGAIWTGGAFNVTFRAGFADQLGSPVTGAEVVPGVLKHAIKLIIANYDQNREPVNVGNIVQELPLNLKWLLQSQKCDLGMA